MKPTLVFVQGNTPFSTVLKMGVCLSLSHARVHVRLFLSLFLSFSVYICACVGDCESLSAEWRRCIGRLKLQVSFRKRATNCRVLLRKITYTDKASCGILPLCICLYVHLSVCQSIYRSFPLPKYPYSECLSLPYPHVSIYVSIHLSVNLSMILPLHTFLCL